MENTELFADCESRLATIEFEIIHQALATMHLLEQRGGGFARMRDRMPNHGLDTPLCAQQDGYFVITFHSPKGDDERLKLPEGASGIITSAVEAQLSDRQRKIVSMLLRGDSQASRVCQRKLKRSAPVRPLNLRS